MNKILLEQIPEWPHAMLYEKFLSKVVDFYKEELRDLWAAKAIHPYAYSRGIAALTMCNNRTLEEIMLSHLRAVERHKNSTSSERIIMGLDSYQLNYGKVVACLLYAYGVEPAATQKIKNLCAAILEGKDDKKTPHVQSIRPNNKAS